MTLGTGVQLDITPLELRYDRTPLQRGFSIRLETVTFLTEGRNKGINMSSATQSVAKHFKVLLRDAGTGAGASLTASIIAALVVKISKGGLTSYATISPTLTAVGTTGLLDLALTALNLDTIGVSAINITGPSIIPNDDLIIDVVAINLNDSVRAGLTALPNAAAGSSGGLPAIDANLNVSADLARWRGTAPATVTSNGYVQSALLRWLTDNSAGTPVALSTNGLVQSMLRRWLTDDAGGTPDALSSGKLPADIKLWLTSAPAALTTNGYVQSMILRWLSDNSGGTPNALVSGDMPSDVTQWKGQVPDSLSSGKVAADLKLWLASAPAALSASGYVQSMVLRWLTDNGGGTPDALSSGKLPADVKLWLTAAPDALSSGKLPADVKLWLTAAPAALTANGYVQSMLLRWLTDNAGGTPDALSTGKLASDVKLWLTSAPDALSSGKVPADIKLWLTAAPASLSTSGFVKSVLLRWLTDDAGGTPNALTAGQVDSTGGGGSGAPTAEEVADAVMAFVLRAGAGSDPDSTVMGHLRRMDALFFNKVSGLLGALVRGYQPGGITVEFSANQDGAAGTREEVDRTTSETP